MSGNPGERNAAGGGRGVDHASERPDLFLRACRGRPVPMAPVWMMRQAGRYLPEYRALKERHDFLTLCRTPDLAAEVTLQPLRRFPLDAAILFSDILIPVEPMGIGLRFDPGPILERAVNTEEAIARLRPLEAEETCGFVRETIRILRRELEGIAPLIGFCGAPFTVAAYLAEAREPGKAKGNFDTIVRMIFERPDLAHRLIDHLTAGMADYLSAQIRAGAQAVQIFDSWGGILGPREFREFALEPTRRLISQLPEERGPVIYFVLNGGHLLEEIATSGADVIGIDWRTPLDQARARIAGASEPGAGPRATSLQGNLDPRALFAPPGSLREEVRRVLLAGAAPSAARRPVPAASSAPASTPLPASAPTAAATRGSESEPVPVAAGHVFNLGHGILPDTPLDGAEHLVASVHEISAELYRARAWRSAA